MIHLPPRYDCSPAGVVTARMPMKRLAPVVLSPVAGSAVWYKGDVGTYQDTGFATAASANGDNLKGWRDQSGNGRDTTLVSVVTSHLATGAINGLNAVNFDGSGITLRTTYSGYGTTFDIYALMQQTTWVAGTGLIQDASQNRWGLAQRISGGVSPEWDWVEAASTVTHMGSVLALNTWAVLTISSKGAGTGTYQINQGTETNIAAPLSSASPANIELGTAGANGHWQCAEFLFYTSNLGSTDRANNVSYLGQRGGLF